MESRKRILVLSDSLALPRNKPEQTKLEDSYSFLLNQKFDVIQMSLGGGTVNEIVQQSNYYTSFNPDFVVLQSGIVDCAYRAFPLVIDKGSIYSKVIDVFRRIIARLINPRRLRSLFRFRYTSPKTYKNQLMLLKERFNDSIIIAIGIVPASKEYEMLVPGIKESIQEYNKILYELFQDCYISLDDMGFDCIMTDHHHINSLGHKHIYNRIFKKNWQKC